MSEASRRLGGFTRRERPSVGIRPTVLFAISLALTVFWTAFGVVVSAPWRDDLEDAIGPVMAWVIPIMLAYVPGFVIGFLVWTTVLSPYRIPRLEAPSGPWAAGTWPDVTILVAAWNEEDAIEPTLDRIAGLSYPGRIEVVLADNNSTDRTAELGEAAAARLGLDYRRVFEPTPGKFHALNTALETVTTPIVVTVDADTFLHQASVSYLVARVASRPQDQHVCACAGALVVENDTATMVTRMQSWDYRLGINGVKRMQGTFNSTLVAEGAFSAYWVEDVRAVGGWPDAIGEDIVLTWSLMDARGLVQYEPLALGFTLVPEKLKALMRQRARWARGMLEGLHKQPPMHQPRVLAKFVGSIDYLVPILDIGFIFFWIPGVLLFVLGYPIIFGWWSMLLLPLTVVIFGFLRWGQNRYVFRHLEIQRARNGRGFWAYLLVYQVFCSWASLRGYRQFLLGGARKWR
jgi:biofilm PGA synthesis N-glycosyltransferase PgaC